MRLDGTVVFVAGGTGALGQTVTPMFSKAGAKVVVVYSGHRPELVEGQVAIQADVTDEDSVRRAVSQTIEQAGRIDCLVNMVGGYAPGRVAETETALWQKMLSLNLTAAFLLSKAMAPHMLKRGSGRILHIAARAALDPFPGAAAYVVAKSGLVALIRVLAAELAGSGVTANGVLPTTIDTPANRKNMPDADPSKWVRPESIAQLLIFLASEEAGQLNGALIPVGSG